MVHLSIVIHCTSPNHFFPSKYTSIRKAKLLPCYTQNTFLLKEALGVNLIHAPTLQTDFIMLLVQSNNFVDGGGGG